MNDEQILSEETRDYITEIMNIAAGNAAGAIRQMISREVNIKVPEVNILQASKVPSVIFIDGSDASVSCVRMKMLGDITGDIYFIVPKEQKKELIRTAELASPAYKHKAAGIDESVLMELGNITTGVYLRALHDFCWLNIFHTVPCLANDMLQSLLDESLSLRSRENHDVFLIVNEFIIENGAVTAYLLLIPSFKSINKLKDSINDARKGLGIEKS